MDENLIDEKNIYSIAKELIDVKRQIIQLKEAEKLFKEQIKLFLKENGPIRLDSAQIYYGESKGSRSFSRVEVLEYIKQTYSDDLANEIDNACTKIGDPKQTVYVKFDKNI